MSKFVELPPQDYDRNAFDAFASQHGHFDLGDARAMMWMAQLSNETGAPQTIVQIAPLWGFKPIPHLRAGAGDRPPRDHRRTRRLHGGRLRRNRSGAGEKSDHRRRLPSDGERYA